MTTTLIYGSAADGYLTSSSTTSYTSARNGPPGAANGTSAAGYYGQAYIGSAYVVQETFLRFAYPPVPSTELVTSAVIRVYQLSQASTGVVRDMEIRGAPWGTTLEVGDWRTPAQLGASLLFGRVPGVQASQGKWTATGSEALRAGVQAYDFQELVVVTSRQRVGNTPTVDEVGSLATADQAGTAFDPCLVYTTTPLTDLASVMGMEAQLSDGSWVFGVAPAGTGQVTLIREDQTGVATTVGTLSLGASASDWASVPAAQGVTLTVDDSDNIYAVGRAGDAPNSLRLRAYVKAPGSWTWSAGAARTVPLPAHDSPVNNVTTAWHPTAGGTLVVFASHMAGDGATGGVNNEVAWALISSPVLLGGSGTLLRASGPAPAAGLLPIAVNSADHNGWSNETGSGLDVVADRTQRDWGYLVSFRRGQRMGDNGAIPVGRYQLSGTGSALLTSLHEEKSAYGRKDAAGKLRILAVGSGQVVVVSADADAGYGLTVQVLQSNGTAPGWVSLGYVRLSGEGIPTVPDGPAVAASLAWDAIYSASENAVWVYYVSTTDQKVLRRTSVNLSTYQATRTDVAVHTATAPIRAVRAPRNAWLSGPKTHVTVAGGGYVSVIDTLNLAPLAPTLTPRANYDATTADVYAWTFRDPNAGDTQSAYQLQIVRVSDGVTVYDTGKVASAAQSRTVPANTLTNGQDYRWRVTTWDALGVGGPWSDYGTFAASSTGTVVITDPAVDNPPDVITDDYLVQWAMAGAVQAKVRVWVTVGSAGVTVYDSGWLTTAATSHRVQGMPTDVEHTIRVQVETPGAIRTNTAFRLITPRYGTPEPPLLQAVPNHEGGYVLVSVTNPPPQGDRPDVVRNRILRRRAGSGDPWDDLGTCQPDGSLRDYTAPGGVPLEYVARGETI